jgi:hypothetical protein
MAKAMATARPRRSPPVINANPVLELAGRLVVRQVTVRLLLHVRPFAGKVSLALMFNISEILVIMKKFFKISGKPLSKPAGATMLY